MSYILINRTLEIIEKLERGEEVTEEEINNLRMAE